MYKIAITGPESTGKSALTESLAGLFNTNFVTEYAREYIENLSRPYEFYDLLNIAKGQLKSEDLSLKTADKVLFCDTELSVVKIWSEVRYQKCQQEILDLLYKRTYDLYLVTDVDLPWVYDPQREHPDFRPQLLKLYIEEMQSRNLPWELVSGIGEKRICSALNHIYRHIPELQSLFLSINKKQFKKLCHD